MLPMMDNPKLRKMRTPASIIYKKSWKGTWKDSEAAVMLVALLAAPCDRLSEIDDLFEVTPANVLNIPSASLAEAFKTAKVKALGGQKITTVIVVSLVDVYMLEMQEMGLGGHCTSFGHDFVLGVGPEGVVLWQGSVSCSFHTYLAQGGASVKNWAQAEDFVKDFGKLTDGRKVCLSWYPRQGSMASFLSFTSFYLLASQFSSSCNFVHPLSQTMQQHSTPSTPHIIILLITSCQNVTILHKAHCNQASYQDQEFIR